MSDVQDWKNVLVFFVNGHKVELSNVNPEWTLLSFLRNKMRLFGTKVACGEGGCGACTVMVSKMNREQESVSHFSVNACLAPLVSMHGKAVTTVEGIGSPGTRLHAVQERIIKAHGSQCGFCTPGMVMSMYTLLRNDPQPNMNSVKQYLAGNLCRCTGYRPILEGFRSLTTEAGQCGRKDCCRLNGASHSDFGNRNGDIEELAGEEVLFDSSKCEPYDPSQEVIFPPELKLCPDLDMENLKFEGPRVKYFRPISLKYLLHIKQLYPEAKIIAGNTEIGVKVKSKKMFYPVLVNPSSIPELTAVKVVDGGVTFGAAVTLTQMEDFLKEFVAEQPGHKCRAFAAILEMLQSFGNRQIRNVATLGGNIMTASPVSDLNPVLLASQSKLHLQSYEAERYVVMDKDFFTGYRQTLAKSQELLVSVYIPYTDKNEYVAVYKQARRRTDDISIVTAAIYISLRSNSLIVQNINLVFGGMATTTVVASKTMAALQGSLWDESIVKTASPLLLEDLPLSPSAPGGMVQYRHVLVLSIFFKFFLRVKDELSKSLPSLAPQLTPNEKIALVSEEQTLKSTQFFQKVHADQSPIDPLGRPVMHTAACRHSTGEAVFMDDVPRNEGELQAAFVLSSHAHAYVKAMDVSHALAVPGVYRVVTSKDLPEERNVTGVIVKDEEVLASERVQYIGQPVAIVLAKDADTARQAAALVRITYEDISPAVITISDAIREKSWLNPFRIKKGDLEKGFMEAAHVIEGELHIGGQEHFYLEPQACLAIPKENDEMEVLTTTQNVTLVQEESARILGIACNQVTARVKRIGGGFGGKETRILMICLPVVLAAKLTKQPVRCVLDREEDMLMTGTRHPIFCKWKVGVTAEGLFTAIKIDYYLNCGFSNDISLVVAQKALFTSDNCYMCPNVDMKAHLCKTNLASNTAFRSIGAIQAVISREDIMTRVAETLCMDPLMLREKNMYQTGDLTHFNQKLLDVTVQRCWNQVLHQAQYSTRRQQVDAFNRENQYKKRGLAAVPLQYGVGFHIEFMNQGGALVHIYKDGSVLLSHGGIEMGQGLHTKMIQVASRVLELPMEKIHTVETSTTTVPNTTSTAASMSSDINGMAVMKACQELKERLQPYKEQNPKGDWNSWIMAAYLDRVSLSATGFYRVPGVSDFNFEKNEGTPFSYFSYGAGVSEVEIDCLTGDHQVLRTDIVMDVGKSLNPAIDIGQIEGAFMQGLGLVTLEELRYSPSGALLTRGPGTYKIPGFDDIPKEFNVSLLQGSSNPRAVYSSKAIGEPPLLLAVSVYLALRDAVKAHRRDFGLNDVFRFDTPATVERIRLACTDHFCQQVPKDEPGTFIPWDVTV